MALPGISNANECYCAHCLESVLAGDIKQVPLLGEVSNANGEPWLWVVARCQLHRLPPA